MRSSSEPYVSCILIKGRPILPPVMTAFRCAEMRRYKELAVAVEAKNRQRKRALVASASCGTTKRNVNFVLVSGQVQGDKSEIRVVDLINQEINRTRIRESPFPSNQQQRWPTANFLYETEDARTSTRATSISPAINSISTPPSVASTDLDRYMSARPESGHRDPIPELDADEDVPRCRPTVSDVSSTVTLTPDGPPDEPSDASPSEDECFGFVPGPRRSSYTLDRPSPVLIEHFRRMAVGREPENAEDRENHRRSDRGEDVVEGGPSRPNGPSQDFDPSVREQHLHRYLRQVASLSSANSLDLPGASAYIVDGLLDEPESAFEAPTEASGAEPGHLRERRDAEPKSLRRELDSSAEQRPGSRLPPAIGTMPPRKDRSSDDVGKNRDDPQPRDAEESGEENRSGSALPPSDFSGTRSPAICVEDCGPEARDARRRLSQDRFSSDSASSRKFQRLSAAVKGYLTRRLLRTEKVQAIIQTIKDTLEFALQLHSETPLKRGCVTSQDAGLHQRLIAQLSGACFEFHDVFFKLATGERMNIIAQDRASKRQKTAQKSRGAKPAENNNKRQHRRLSAATLKSIERKRHHGRLSCSPLGTYATVGGRSPRSRTSSGRSRKQMLGNALDEARAHSASPRFAHRRGTEAAAAAKSRRKILTGLVEAT